MDTQYWPSKREVYGEPKLAIPLEEDKYACPITQGSKFIVPPDYYLSEQ